MKTNTDSPLKFLPTEEVERRLNAVESNLLNESFGNDHEAYYESMKERSKLFQQLKRRGVRG